MEASSPPVLAKRLWNIARIVFFMIRKGISKRKLMVDFHLMMKRGKIAGKKAIGSLMFHHHHHFKPNFSCRTTSFAPREYEFSCSNSPAFPFFHPNNNTTTSRRHKNHHNYFSCIHPSAAPEDDIAALQKALEMLDTDTASGVLSPVSVLPGFGFGKSPMVRQLRITDSPFPLKEGGEEDGRVDKEAEEFIGRFYEQLRLQNKMTALESMYRREMMTTD